MRRFLFVAVLCASIGASAQFPSRAQDIAAQVNEKETEATRRTQSLANTIGAFQLWVPAISAQSGGPQLPEKREPAAEATCTTYLLPYAGVSAGQNLWGVLNEAIPSSTSCYLSTIEPWDFWSVPAKAGERITFALETSVRTYFSIESGSVFYGSSTLQPNGKYLTGYVWNVPASFTSSTARITVSPYATSAIYTLAVGKPVSGAAACTATSTNLCLNNGRFKVETTYVTSTAQGSGNASTMTGDTGYFWFFAASNVEVLVKVVDGRGINGKFWVFAGGLTNVDTTIRITDTQTGAVKSYRNPANTAFQPIQDTSAF